MYIKEGSREKDLIKEIQKEIGVLIDGDFGPMTKAAVQRWQLAHGLNPDGIVGPDTMEEMGILDTDISNNLYKLDNGLQIERYHLPRGEYIENPKNGKDNDYVFIHHTAGWENPYRVIDSWGRDSRGRVATEFVIGGQKVTTNADKHDGRVLQAFPEGCQGWHLGRVGSDHMRRHSVGIEICAFGYLKGGKTYVGGTVIKNQVSELDEEFRGFYRWHKYSDAQIESTRKLLLHIAKRDNIDLKVGLVEWIHKYGGNKAFEFQQEAYEGNVKGLLTHTNVRKDKYDNFPQPELIDMLLTL